MKNLPNKPLQPELESCAVIENHKPDKLILIEPVLANLSNPVKRGRYVARCYREPALMAEK